MTRVFEFRGICTAIAAVAASMMLSGCLGGPTYGTGRSANAQLVDDVMSIASITPPKSGSEVAYKPRPDIVTPPPGTALPAPQQSLASRENPQWPESPEETRQRLVDDATNADNKPGYRSPLGQGDNSTTPEQRKQFQEAKAQQKGAYAERRLLSDPPEEYREPAATAPTDELGEPEYVKERRRKKQAQKKDGFSLGKLWPF